MSSTTLSQNEIDKLLGRSGGPHGDMAPPTGQPEAQRYDFRRPHRVSKDRLRTLEAMYEQLVKTLEGWLLGRVRGQIELRLQSVEQFSFGEFILSLPMPCSSYLLDIRGYNGQQGIIDFGPEFAAFLVDRLFGGGGGKPRALNRSLTPIERMAIRSVAERVTMLLQDVWRDHVQLDLLLGGFESIPEILLGANRDDPVLVATVEVIAGGTSSLLLLCLPFTALEKFFSTTRQQKISVPESGQSAATREIAEASLREAGVDVAARLPELRLSMRDLAALKVGGVLTTGIPCDTKLEVLVNGQPRFEASPGRVGGRLALRILEEIHSAPARPGAQPNQVK